MQMMAEYARALIEAGHSVLLAHGDSTAQSPTLPPAGIRLLESLSNIGVQCHSFANFRSTYSKQLESSLRELITQKKPDVMVGFHQLDRKYALRLAPQTKVPCVISAQNKHVFWGVKPVAWLKEFVYRKLLQRNLSSVICTSEVIQSELRNRFGIDETRCTLIPNGIQIPSDKINSDRVLSLRNELGVADHEVMFVNTGRIDIQKGQDIMLEAWDRVSHNNWRMFFIGSVSQGPNMEKMQVYEGQLLDRRQSMKNGEKITFLGWRDDVRDLLSAADCYVHPARWEGWPLAVCEAMAEHKPIIASDCVGSPIGFVQGEHGYIFPSENVIELASALDSFLKLDRAQYPAMGASCRAIAEKHYDMQTIRKQIVAHLEKFA